MQMHWPSLVCSTAAPAYTQPPNTPSVETGRGINTIQRSVSLNEEDENYTKVIPGLHRCLAAWLSRVHSQGPASLTLHRSTGPATRVRRTMLPWFVAVQGDDETLVMAESGTCFDEFVAIENEVFV